MSADNSLSGLMKYVSRDEWADHLADVLAKHFSVVRDELDLALQDVPDLIGEHWMTTLWGCAFEDLLTRSVGPDDLNIVEVFLKRRGWNEKPQDKFYMKALRNSVMSLYEVSDVVPGSSLRARDLLRGGEPVLVHERSATQSLKQWDKIAARIVSVGNKNFLAGGVLPFSAAAATAFTEAIHGSTGRLDAHLPIDDTALREAAPLFSNAWLMDILANVTGKKKPVLQNSDGELVLFHTLRFPFAGSVTQEVVAARLNEIDSMRQETATFWNWLGGKAPDRPAAATVPNALAWNVTMDDGSIVLGNVELNGRFLNLMVNSAGRAAEGRALLERALDGLVREPFTEIQTVDEMRAEGQRKQRQEAVPVEIAAPLVQEMLDKYYRSILDEPVGMLGEISPRAAVRTEKGRENVAAWLKHLENMSANDERPGNAMALYDFGWLWRELKIENLLK